MRHVYIYFIEAIPGRRAYEMTRLDHNRRGGILEGHKSIFGGGGGGG